MTGSPHERDERRDGPRALARRLGTGDAVVLGLGSMLGAGVFVVFAPAARAAGSALLLGLGVAAVIAYANASASAQLAAQYPTSGGTYVYGRERLGPWWGFVAGWGFVVGKTASLAAMAMTFAAYAVPVPWQRPVAAGAVVVLAAIGYRGVTRTARAARVLVVAVLAALGVVVAAGLLGASPVLEGPVVGAGGGSYGVLQAAGLLFFAFAGFARVATLGEEVRDPARTIPRAVGLALGVVTGVYLLVGLALLAALGPDALAVSTEPLVDAVVARGWPWAVPLVRAGAAAAALGALLALLAGVGRTALAMARAGDLPSWLAAVHPVHRTPHHAEVAVAGTVVLLVAAVDLRGVIGFSSFGVLVYYLVANVAAATQRGVDRRSPRALQVLGAAGCTLLVVTLPPAAVLSGLAVLALGVGVRALGSARR